MLIILLRSCIVYISYIKYFHINSTILTVSCKKAAQSGLLPELLDSFYLYFISASMCTAF